MAEVPNLKQYIKRYAGTPPKPEDYTSNFNPLGWMLPLDAIGPSPSVVISSDGMGFEDHQRLLQAAFDGAADYADANGVSTEQAVMNLYADAWYTEFQRKVKPEVLLSWVALRADLAAVEVRYLAARVDAIQYPAQTDD